MKFLAYDWMVSSKIVLSRLAKISKDHNANLVFVGSAFSDEKGFYYRRIVIKGNENDLEKFIEDLRDNFIIENWYSVDEDMYKQGILFDKLWNELVGQLWWGYG